MSTAEDLKGATAITSPGNNITSWLYNEKFSIADARVVARALMHENNKVKILSVGFCHLGTKEIEMMAEALMHANNRIEKLHFSSNIIIEGATKALAVALMHENNKIQHLILEFCNLGDEEAEAFAKALVHTNNKVKRLILCFNAIEDDGIKMLAGALMHENNKVQHLDLSQNCMGNEGCRALTKALTHPNCVIKTVYGIDEKLVKNAIKDRCVFKTLLLLLSAREMVHGAEKPAVRKLPSELIRLVAGMVRINARDERDAQVETS